MRRPTGVELLDRLLDGGLPARSLSLVHGPSFAGDAVLAQQIALANLAHGTPAIFVLTRSSVAEARARFARMDPRAPDYEQQGMLRFVDTCSRSIGAGGQEEHVAYTESAGDFDGIAAGLQRNQAVLRENHENHLVVVDSLSTMVLQSDAPSVFRFIQVLAGRSKRAGATTVMLLDDGMHGASEVQVMRHICDGVFILRRDNENMQLRIEGFDLVENPGWLDYRFTPQGFDVTGTLAGGRIQ